MDPLLGFMTILLSFCRTFLKSPLTACSALILKAYGGCGTRAHAIAGMPAPINHAHYRKYLIIANTCLVLYMAMVYGGWLMSKIAPCLAYSYSYIARYINSILQDWYRSYQKSYFQKFAICLVYCSP